MERSALGWMWIFVGVVLLLVVGRLVAFGASGRERCR